MKQNSRILWVTNLPAPYRLRIWDELSKFTNLNLVFLLSQDNWRNWRITYFPNWGYTFLNFRHFRFREIDLIIGIRGIRRHVRETGFILLTAWEAPIYFYVLYLAKKYDIPCAIFYESTQKSHNFNGRLIGKIRKLFFQNVDLIVTPGKSSTEAITNMQISNKKILTLFNPVDVETISGYVKKLERSDKKGHIYIFVGRLIALKNVENLIRAFAEIRNANDKLIVVGSGKLESELIKVSSLIGVASQVKFVGEKRNDQLLDVLSRAHTLVLPSFNEVWGMVVNEALACGLHVVVSKNCGVCDLVNDHSGVYICDTDTRSIARRMAESREQWKGWISKPEILDYGAEKFASEIRKSLLKLQP